MGHGKESFHILEGFHRCWWSTMGLGLRARDLVKGPRLVAHMVLGFRV